MTNWSLGPWGTWVRSITTGSVSEVLSSLGTCWTAKHILQISRDADEEEVDSSCSGQTQGNTFGWTPRPIKLTES